MTEDQRAERLRRALADSSMLVRIEAVRAYAKRSAASHGCAPLLDALRDDAQHVVNAALDALGPACPGNDDVTAKVAAEARTPPSAGSWHREAHAFVALASRDPDRAGAVMRAFATHPVWEVRMYAARAAAAMKDESTLARLAEDESDNVRRYCAAAAAGADWCPRRRGHRRRAVPLRYPGASHRGDAAREGAAVARVLPAARRRAAPADRDPPGNDARRAAPAARRNRSARHWRRRP